MNAQLGFGVMRMPYLDNGQVDLQESQRMFDEYMKGDFCYFDTHPGYVNSLSQRLIRHFVVDRYPRDSFLLADKMPYFSAKSKEDYIKIFANELHECNVEYFDYYLLHCITRKSYQPHKELGGFDFLKWIKRQGRAKHIGFSFHDKADFLEEILSTYPEVEFVQLQINYLDWEDPIVQSRKNYEVAKKYGKKIFVMEPIKGGSLANLQNLELGFAADLQSLASLALRFVASLDVDIILSGMSTLQNVIDNRETFSQNLTFTEDDMKRCEMARTAIRKSNRIPCTACRYCIKECPKNISIPDILYLLNACGRTGIHDRTYRGRYTLFYNGYTFNKGKASDCIKCGKCETRCPQRIPIRKHLQNAKTMFEG